MEHIISRERKDMKEILSYLSRVLSNKTIITTAKISFHKHFKAKCLLSTSFNLTFLCVLFWAIISISILFSKHTCVTL